MGSKPPQTRKGQQGFPFQTLPHSAGNGREKGGAGVLERNDKSGFVEESNLLVLNKLERLLTVCFKPKENYTRSELLKVNEK